MKKLLIICAIALLSCKKNTDIDLNLTGNWVLQTSMVEYFDANNKKLCESSPSELQYLKNIEIKDGNITLKPNEVKSAKAVAQKKVFDVTVLPVTLISFKATSVENGVLLMWITANEVNSNYFEVFKSTDGSNFKSIAAIKSNGINDLIVNYSFLDTNPGLGTIYYRISQVDLDGTSQYFTVVSVTKNTLPFVPVKEEDNYTFDLSPSNLAGFSKMKFTMPNPDTMEWGSTANNVTYTGCGVTDSVAHHAVLKMVYVKQ